MKLAHQYGVFLTLACVILISCTSPNNQKGQTQSGLIYPNSWLLEELRGHATVAWIQSILFVTPDSVDEVGDYYLQSLYSKGWTKVGNSSSLVHPDALCSWGGFFQRGNWVVEFWTGGHPRGGVWEDQRQLHWNQHYIHILIYRGDSETLLGTGYRKRNARQPDLDEMIRVTRKVERPPDMSVDALGQECQLIGDRLNALEVDLIAKFVIAKKH